ncbi:NADP-dependent oxidoreductase domain-containing protein [Lentinula edodes]|nr:NADP-dependent oxidoreductase domain-containing protein [Lentinula edodes]
MDYVNMIFAHRPDPTVMMEEIVRAFNYEIEKGWVLYWVTSEWPAWEIEDAFHSKAKELGSVVKELETTIAALALTWVAKHPDTSTVILGATRPQQIVNNLKAIEVLPKLLPPVMEKIEDMLGNKPSGSTTYHPPLDEFGRQ